MDSIKNQETQNVSTTNSTEQDESVNKSYAVLEKKKKIRDYINGGNFKEILSFLSKEDMSDLAEVMSDAMDERNSKLFWRKLDEYCAETLDEAEHRRKFEDIQIAIAYEDMIRGQKNSLFRQQMTSHINDLKEKNSNGDYLTVGDRHFLEEHDEAGFNISEQNRANKFRKEKYDSMSELGKINAIGKNKVNKGNILAEINRLIQQKQQFISRGGDLSNCAIDFDKQIEQLYMVLSDVSKMESALLDTFSEEREKQRQVDASVRSKQVAAMQQANQDIQEMQHAVSENVDSKYVGGMGR